MMALTVFILFSDELRLLYFPPEADTTYQVLTTIAFMLFLAEIISYSWIKSDFSEGFWKVKGYMFSFFFWLDLMALLSLVLELAWLVDLLHLPDLSSDPISRGDRSNIIHVKFGRVLRMARLVRLVKLYKISSKRKRDKQVFQDLQWLVESGDNEINREELEECLKHDEKQSKVGVKLSDIITRRVIVAVLLMLCVVPLLSYQSRQEDEILALDLLHSINIDAGDGLDVDCDFLIGSFHSFIDFMSSLRGSFLIGVTIFPTRCKSDILIDFIDSDKLDSLRDEFVQTYMSPEVFIEGTNFQVTAIYNMTSFANAGCRERILLMILVIAMLVVLSKQFSHDAEKLVLEPINNMMEMVNLVAHEPLEDFDFDASSSVNQYETKQVQVAIQKITKLLRVGFGIAGAEIISMNMAVDGGTRSAVLDPMIPGKRIYAIFGFCDIHDFDLCTEKLEDEIMTFVNQIAKIVHDEVSRWGGRCNKNLGNAFLMVWRLGDEALLRKMNGPIRRRSIKKSITAESINKPDSVDLRTIPGNHSFENDVVSKIMICTQNICLVL